MALSDSHPYAPPLSQMEDDTCPSNTLKEVRLTFHVVLISYFLKLASMRKNHSFDDECSVRNNLT